MSSWLIKELKKNQDIKYRDFNAQLIPNIDKKTMIGVRTPILRKIAKEFSKRKECESFLQSLPHQYYEENVIHASLISMEKEYSHCIQLIHSFLPYVDNWAICDGIAPICFKKHLNEVEKEIKGWLKSKETYTIRFGIGMYLKFFLDEAFKPSQLKEVSKIHSKEYYVNMMIAWYFATALAKQWDSTIPYLEKQILDSWTHNKTIQKAIESYRITDAQKEYLRTLRVK